MTERKIYVSIFDGERLARDSDGSVLSDERFDRYNGFDFVYFTRQKSNRRVTIVDGYIGEEVGKDGEGHKIFSRRKISEEQEQKDIEEFLRGYRNIEGKIRFS